MGLHLPRRRVGRVSVFPRAVDMHPRQADFHPGSIATVALDLRTARPAGRNRTSMHDMPLAGCVVEMESSARHVTHNGARTGHGRKELAYPVPAEQLKPPAILNKIKSGFLSGMAGTGKNRTAAAWFASINAKDQETQPQDLIKAKAFRRLRKQATSQPQTHHFKLGSVHHRSIVSGDSSGCHRA